MAESTTPSTQTTAPTAAKTESSPSAKQYIKPSTYDDELEPDALRGSEHVIRDTGVENQEESRRDVYRTEDERKARDNRAKEDEQYRQRRAQQNA